MKTKMPKLGGKQPRVGMRLPHRGVRTAFGSGKGAFPLPSTAVQPDQAFQGAMGLPQGDNAPLTPPPSPPEG